MFIVNDANQAYWFHSEQIRTIEEKYGARYMGYWCIKDPQGRWTDRPLEVFHDPNPNLELGHSRYFGFFVNSEQQVRTTDAASAFSVPMTGILLKSGEVLVSRYTHDYKAQDGEFVDGGREYLRYSANSVLVSVRAQDSEFVLEPVLEFA